MSYSILPLFFLQIQVLFLSVSFLQPLILSPRDSCKREGRLCQYLTETEADLMALQAPPGPGPSHGVHWLNTSPHRHNWTFRFPKQIFTIMSVCTFWLIYNGKLISYKLPSLLIWLEQKQPWHSNECFFFSFFSFLHPPSSPPLNWPLSRFRLLFRYVRLSSVCLSICLCYRGKLTSRWTRDLWLKGVSLILAYLHRILVFFVRFNEFYSGFWVLQTSLLYIRGELAGGGSVAVAFGVSDMCGWQVTNDTWHMTCNMWYLTCDMYYMTHFFSLFI